MVAEHRILVVEDDRELGTTLADVLRDQGFDVDLVVNGAEAIELLETSDLPCVVLVDLLMPGIVGQELLEYLRSDERFAAIPVAIVSGSPQLAPDGYRVFPKPLHLRPLLDFVRQGCSIG